MNRTYNDVAETLSNYPSLSPRTEVYSACQHPPLPYRSDLRLQHQLMRMELRRFCSSSAGPSQLPFAARLMASPYMYGCHTPTLASRR